MEIIKYNIMEEKYLGDGVYVSVEHGSIWLAVNDHNNKVVCLEPAVMERLIMYYEQNKKMTLED